MPENNLPTNRVAFSTIPYGSYFRFPHNTCPWQKAGQGLADVPANFRMHPSAPRCGFVHPSPCSEVIPMTTEEFGMLGRRPKPSGIVAFEFGTDGVLYVTFDTSESRMEFLPSLIKVLDPAQRVALRMGKGEGSTCRVGIHFSELITPLTITADQVT